MFLLTFVKLSSHYLFAIDFSRNVKLSTTILTTSTSYSLHHTSSLVVAKSLNIQFKKEQKISPNGNYMFGYYDKKQTVSINNKTLILQGKIPFYNREPTASDEMIVGWVSKSEPNLFNKIGKTTAWNLQQGCMMEWVNQTHVIYNIKQNGFKALISDLYLKNTVYPLPVFALGRSKYISLSFERIHQLRRGYGYTVKLQDIDHCPKTDGIWTVDLITKEVDLLFSFYHIRDYLINQGHFDASTNMSHVDKVPQSGKYYWWVNLPMWSDDNKYISFLVRASDILHGHSYKFSALIIANVETRELWRVPKLRGSHPFFRTFLLNCESTGTYKIEYKKYVKKLKWQPNVDGHCSLSPDEKWILTDTYPIPKKAIIIEELEGTRQYLLGKYAPHNEGPIYTRCDLHPRWSFDGSFVIFDSTHDGFRSLYSLNFKTDIPTYEVA